MFCEQSVQIECKFIVKGPFPIFHYILRRHWNGGENIGNEFERSDHISGSNHMTVFSR